MDERMVGKVLRRAAELVRQGWTCGKGARDGQGRAVNVDSLAAESWCVGGAINRATLDLGFERCSPAFDALYASAGWPTGNYYLRHTEWNDAPGRTAEEVAALLERAAGEP